MRLKKNNGFLAHYLHIIIVGVILASTVALSNAGFPNGQLYPFTINDLLTCHVDNPRGDLEGEEAVVPEEIIRLPFEMVETQGDHPNPIWLPGPSGYVFCEVLQGI